MPSDAGKYLETEVLTASPQKLQLMLIEAAGRFAAQALRHWQADEDDQAAEALIRAQNIVSELIGGLRLDDGGELVRRVAGVYVYVFRSLVQANLHRDADKLRDAQRVLAAERETWQKVCQELDAQGGSGSQSETPTMSKPPQAVAPPKFLAPPPTAAKPETPPSGSFNLEM